MDKKVWTIPASLDAIRRLKDRSVSLRFVSMLELPNDKFHELSDSEFSDGWLLWSQNPITETDAPTMPAKGDGKSPSVRMYNVLYRLWEQSDQAQEFRIYYENRMNNAIEKLKEALT